MNRYVKFLSGLLVVALIVGFSGCGGKEQRTFLPVSPRLVSGIQDFSFSGLEDDHLFFGDWGGVEFDGKNFRTLHAKGGGLRFETLSSETRMLHLSVRTERRSTLSVSLNDRKIKELATGANRQSLHKILLPRRLLRLDENRLSIQNRQSEPVKIYRLRLIPARLVNKYKYPQGTEVEEIVLPARLSYFLWPQADTFEISFDKPVQHILLSLADEQGKIREFPFKNKGKVNIDLIPWQDKMVKLTLQLKDPHKIVRIKTSGFWRRKAEREKSDPIAKVEKQWLERGGQYNVLILLLDSARPDRFSAYGCERQTTPHIDRLAQNALVFSRANAEAAYTLASTASLFSGLPPDYHNAVSNYYGGLNSDITTLAEMYRRKEYFTAAVSAIPYCGKAFNMQQGFDEFIELFKSKEQALAEEFVPQFKKLVARAQKEEKKFFIYLHIREPHIDFLMKPPFFGAFHQGYESYPNLDFLKRLKEIYFGHGKYRNRDYGAEDIALLSDSYDENLLSADAAVGQILTVLAEEGLSEQTVKIVLADHGEGLNEHGLIGHNVVLYREGLEIPLIIGIPGLTEGKTTVDYPVSTTDLSAALMRAVGQSPPPGPPQSAGGLFQPVKRRLLIGRSIFFARFFPFYVLRQGQYRCLIPFPRSARESRLYDIDTDPAEKIRLDRPFVQEYFYFQLQNFFSQKKNVQSLPRKTDFKKEDLDSLKSLGYL
jgi:arylsulfatase A-like enzyme